MNDKFWFRQHVFPLNGAVSNGTNGTTDECRPSNGTNAEEDNAQLFSINDIINGQESKSGFIGLIPLIQTYLNSLNIDVETRCAIGKYLNLVKSRAEGMFSCFIRLSNHQ